MPAGRSPVSRTKDWCTPPALVESVRRVFGGQIDLDPCSNAHSVVDARVAYALPALDGLVESWAFPTIFVNPPYGTDAARGTRIAHWFARIAEAARAGSEVIAVVPVATNTSHWKTYVYPCAAAVCFLSAPRVRFYLGGREDRKGAPMAVAVVYYGSRVPVFAAEFSQHGVVVPLADVVLPRPAG